VWSRRRQDFALPKFDRPKNESDPNMGKTNSAKAKSGAERPAAQKHDNRQRDEFIRLIVHDALSGRDWLNLHSAGMSYYDIAEDEVRQLLDDHSRVSSGGNAAGKRGAGLRVNQADMQAEMPPTFIDTGRPAMSTIIQPTTSANVNHDNSAMRAQVLNSLAAASLQGDCNSLALRTMSKFAISKEELQAKVDELRARSRTSAHQVNTVKLNQPTGLTVSVANNSTPSDVLNPFVPQAGMPPQYDSADEPPVSVTNSLPNNESLPLPNRESASSAGTSPEPATPIKPAVAQDISTTQRASNEQFNSSSPPNNSAPSPYSNAPSPCLDGVYGSGVRNAFIKLIARNAQGDANWRERFARVLSTNHISVEDVEKELGISPAKPATITNEKTRGLSFDANLRDKASAVNSFDGLSKNVTSFDALCSSGSFSGINQSNKDFFDVSSKDDPAGDLFATACKPSVNDMFENSGQAASNFAQLNATSDSSAAESASMDALISVTPQASAAKGVATSGIESHLETADRQADAVAESAVVIEQGAPMDLPIPKISAHSFGTKQDQPRPAGNNAKQDQQRNIATNSEQQPATGGTTSTPKTQPTFTRVIRPNVYPKAASAAAPPVPAGPNLNPPAVQKGLPEIPQQSPNQRFSDHYTECFKREMLKVVVKRAQSNADWRSACTRAMGIAGITEAEVEEALNSIEIDESQP
jgi:hypothetical protein